jgi:glycosyltransferase involved in cell wall biosynthesis
MRLAVVTSHPIQYHAPWFRALAQRPGLDLEVLYCHKATKKEQSDAGFGVEFDWDRSLLDGYQYRFLRNVAAAPSVTRFHGLDTPELSALLPDYDAVLVSGWHYKSAWQAMWTCWRRKIPVMVRSDSHLHTKRGGLKKLLKEISYREFISRLDACLPVGRWSKEYFVHYGAQTDRIFTVPHVVDEFFEQEAESLVSARGGLRRKWGLEANQTVFLFAGKFIPFKRPLDFVHAIHRANRADRPIAGLMVGDGPLREQCQRLSRDLSVRIHFSGFLNQSEIPQAYTAADALILPSDGSETWGLVVNEAMSCRRPCLVSDQVGCGPDLVSDNETGFIFPFGNVDALASRMMDCASNSVRLTAMGENAKSRIADYSIPAAVDGVVKAVDRVWRRP